ncbi:serine-rich adhesin for platelets-like [Clytia hemisphaerica]|uniref:serine-rich adhesin for platelets-like n=1 Tax=Clytia hemisphaerica TaxID=252671 RepID=UPI0034D67A7D
MPNNKANFNRLQLHRGSPRAFVKYAYDANKRPYPEPFIKGVENSFGNPVVRKRFYKKYYQLLVHKQFPHKETKLCLVGPADSAKTSWFSPFKGIIPARYIAGVMNDGRFSAALIDDQTQIVMMDEWTPDSLSCEDAKRVLQGGMNFLPQKHKEGLRVNYNSGFFITTNVYPDFGNEIDNEAIRKRLDVFQTSSLKRKDPSVEGWLRINCMEVFHYLAEQLKHEPIFDTPTHRWNGAGAAKGMGAVFNDFDFSPMDLMLADENAEFSLSQTPSIPSNNVQTVDADVPSSPSNSKDSATVEAIDHAIMEADRVEGVLYEDLSWDTPLFDNASEKCDEEYVQKVVELASNNEGCWDALHISDKAVSMFRRRARVFWDGPDTVYDAWLVRKGYERPWFDYHLMNCSFPSFDPEAEQEPSTPQQLQLPTVSPLKECLDQSNDAERNEQQSEEINLPSTSTANPSEEEPLKEITSNQPTREETNSASTSTTNQLEEDPLKDITSYQPPREETNSPSTSTANQSEEDPLLEITSYQPPREKTNSPSTSTANQSEEDPLLEITSYQPPREDQTSGNENSDANCTVNPSPPPIPPPPVEQPDRISETSISDLSEQETTPSIEKSSSQGATIPRRRLSLKRCCNAATATVVTSGSETETTKRPRSKSDSIEFDIDRVLPEGKEVVDISSGETSSEDF